MSTLALAPQLRYEAPQIAFGSDEAEVDEVVWWVVWVGFAYLLALAWATYCKQKGGNPEISLTWKGFKVACHGK